MKIKNTFPAVNSCYQLPAAVNSTRTARHFEIQEPEIVHGSTYETIIRELERNILTAVNIYQYLSTARRLAKQIDRRKKCDFSYLYLFICAINVKSALDKKLNRVK